LDVLTAHPINQFKKSRHFYLRYDGFYLLLCSALLVLMYVTGFRPVIGMPAWWWPLCLPPLMFALVWAHLLIHNCTHGNLPRPINRIVGELLGLLVVVRYASWDIVHLRHHKYSDDREKDPHPNFGSFAKTVWQTVIRVEAQLMQQYFDVWGDTPENRRLERRRAWVSYGTNFVLVACWVWLLGPLFVLLVFAPAEWAAGLFVIHFNWSTHNGERGTSGDDFRPVNLNRGYYWIGNKLFSGIYMHANHHRLPGLFDPRGLDARLAGAPEPLADAAFETENP
jgi:fatty acid desaturase